MGSGPWIDGADIGTARILAGWLIDGSGGPIRADVRVDVDDGRVAAAGPWESGIPADSFRPLLDFSDCTLLPPLIDAHVHLFMSATGDPEVRRKQLDASCDALRPTMIDHLRMFAESGVIAVRDGGDYGGYALRFRDERSPHEPVRLRAAGRAWRTDGRYGRLIGRPVPDGRTLAEAIRDDPDPADHVKLVNSGVNSLKTFGHPTPPQFSPQALRMAVAAARERGRPVMVHCNGEEPVRGAVEAGCDSVEHGFFMGAENLDRMAERGTIWVPTAVTMRAYANTLPEGSPEAEIAHRTFEHQRSQIQRARELGVAVAAGTDAGSLGVEHGRAVVWEMGILTEAGFSLAEAVRCATENGARLLGYPDLGRIAPGRPARFLAVEGGPETVLANLGRKRFVRDSAAPVR